MSIHLSSALGSFRLLLKDYEELLEYIYPCDQNKNVFSFRTYELLLRACTEFEYLAKLGAVAHGITLNNSKARVDHLSELYPKLELENTKVAIQLWEPQELTLEPLRGWMEKPHGLSWYRAYNMVKHNRGAAFAEATLENVSLALAGCFLLLQRLGALPLSSSIYRSDHEAYTTDWYFKGIPFVLRTPNNWPPHLRGESAA